MLIEGSEPAKKVSLVVPDAPSMREAVRRFRENYPEGRVEEIDGEIVRGVCACNRPIFENDPNYLHDPHTDGYWCAACMTARKESQ